MEHPATQSLAQQSAKAMWDGDEASRWFGFEVSEVGEGTARLSLRVEQKHCNGHGILHGGITFALADTAFAYACNSRGQRTVAQSCSISYLAPGGIDDQLVADAREVHLKGRGGIYDVTVSRQDGTVLAEFRGQSRAISGRLTDSGAQTA